MSLHNVGRATVKIGGLVLAVLLVTLDASAQTVKPHPNAASYSDVTPPVPERKTREVRTPSGLMRELADISEPKARPEPLALAVDVGGGVKMREAIGFASRAPVEDAVSTQGRLVPLKNGQLMRELQPEPAVAPYDGPPLKVIDLTSGPQGVQIPAEPEPYVLYRLAKPTTQPSKN